jgi:D-3-phosphoglycerate dehydrogenase
MHEAVAKERLIGLVGDADGLIVGLERVDASVIEAGPKLKFIGKPGAGVDNIDVQEATRRGILVCNTAGSNAQAVADHTYALILAVLRQMPFLDDLTRAGKGWDRWPPVIGGELWQKTLGIVGTGAIGRAVAHRARGFEMRILGYDIAPDTAFARVVGLTYVSLQDLLGESDIVTVHVPLVPATEGLLGAKEFATMKKGAFFFNLARGGVVEEEALIEALRSHHLTGAGLDVFSAEPPPPDSPLFALDNVIVSPHVAGFSEEAILKSRMWLAEAARDALGGQVPRTLVNRAVLT